MCKAKIIISQGIAALAASEAPDVQRLIMRGKIDMAYELGLIEYAEHDQLMATMIAACAQNRIDMAALNKKIAALTDWRLPAPAYLTEIRDEYLGEGDRWRGWLHAIEIVEDFHDPELNPITDNQRELAALLDQKAALRAQAGKIKRQFYAAGRAILRAKP